MSITQCFFYQLQTLKVLRILYDIDIKGIYSDFHHLYKIFGRNFIEPILK